MARTEHASIPAPDGIPLAATLFLPDDDTTAPWPAILEALPYRKDDITAHYRPEYARLADAGYVVCRLDVRGTGSSGGIATDEYPAVERTDLAAVIGWLASQAWSSGAVGMYGTSYSGFDSLQLAMERPSALKAIISIFASDDRYGDDVHYMGGVLKGLDVVDYPTYMVAMNALPPVPSVWGEGWREEWRRRVEQTEPWFFTWLEHQRHDDYWRSGSAQEDYGAIEAATMLVGGWADGYTNICLRSFPELTCPKRVLLGPWPHANVETCVPGPRVDLVPEMLRWWDRWLKGVDTGVEDEPPIVLFAQRSTEPDPLRREMRGAWRFEPTWPAERSRPAALALAGAAPGGVAHGDGPDTLEVRGDVGATAWISCAGTMPWGLSSDQRPDEALSLTYTWDALDHEVEVLGHPCLRVRVTSTTPVAFLSAKVCDVFPDGRSSLVVRGVLNLTQRDGRDAPAPLTPGEPVDVELDLEACSWTFEAGHRIRLVLAGADWPNTWSPPTPNTLTVDRASSSLELPVLDGPSPVTAVPILPPPRVPQTDPTANTDDGWSRWEVGWDAIERERRAIATYGGRGRPADGVPGTRDLYGGTVGASADDPGRAWALGESDLEVTYPEATCRSKVTLRLDSDADSYRVAIDLIVSEDGEQRWRRRWDRTFPRDLQ
ncbi:MAG: CocE/NonD family hydrolase [Actinomycetota bacterium]